MQYLLNHLLTLHQDARTVDVDNFLNLMLEVRDSDQSKGLTLMNDAIAKGKLTDFLLRVSNKEPLHQSDTLKLTDGQEKALQKIKRWLVSNDAFFVLKGYAGTGKSFLMKMLIDAESRHNFFFSAPTNKAAGVLSAFLDMQVKTTYSLLGLRMETEDDKKVLRLVKTPDLGTNPILVIDECGMIPEFLARIIKDCVLKKGWRVLFVGDPAQLNPVSESRSIVWNFATPDNRALLTEVKRFDNQLLTLATRIRNSIKAKNFDAHDLVKNDNDGSQGVFVKTRASVLKSILELKHDDWRDTKVCAWRNRTVNYYNELIRESLGFKKPYEVSELILMASPVVSQGIILAHTDQEFEISALSNRLFTYPEGNVDAMSISLEGESFSLYVPKDPSQLEAILNQRAHEAQTATGRQRIELWRKFWDLKETFQSIRYGYCMTVHRLQGSSYRDIYMDKVDILANQDNLESFRCLYVASTRPTNSLTTF